MPYEDPDPTDPMTLHGVAFETDSPDATREMAVCFIEEFLRMDFSPERVLSIFTTPGYAGPHMARQELGEDEIKRLIDEQVALRGPRTVRDTPPAHADGDISLPVIDPIGESHALGL